MADEGQEIEVGVGDKRVKIRGSDILTSVIGMIVCTGLALLWFVLAEHRLDAKDNGRELVTAIKEMTSAQMQSVQAQRVMNCLLATDQKDRREQLTICERLSR